MDALKGELKKLKNIENVLTRWLLVVGILTKALQALI